MFDSVSALLEVRAFGTQRWDQNMVMQRIKHMHKADTIDNVFGYARGTYRRLTTGAGAFAVFAVGAYLLQADSLSVGEFTAFALLYFSVMFNMTILVTLFTEQRIFIIQAAKLFHFMKASPEVADSEHPVTIPAIKGKISFNDVHFAYPQQPALI